MGCRKLIWTPEDEPRASFARGIGGRVSGRRMLNSPVLPGAGFNGQFATLFPGAFQVVQTDLGLTYGGAPLAVGTGVVVGTLSGTLATTPVPILFTCTTPGVIGAGAQFAASYDGGATQAMAGITPAAGTPVPLTGAATGLFMAWAAGSALADNTWTATCAGLADQSGNLKHYSQATASKQPTITVGLNGKVSILTDAVSKCLISTGNLPAPGTTPYYIFAVWRQPTWTVNTVIFGRTSGSGNALYKASVTPDVSSNLPTDTLNSGAALGTWVDAEIKHSNSSSDTCKIGVTIVSGNAGNNALTGIEIGSAIGGTTAFGAVELLAVAFTPNLPDWVAVRAAVSGMYGAGNVLV